MRETTARLISKEEFDYIKDDKKIIEFVTKNLTRDISERLMQVLETNDEIIVKKPVLRVSKYPPANAVEYRMTVDWKPLVRCKDCKHHTDEEPGIVYCGNINITGGWVPNNFFCAHGGSKEQEDKGK